MASGCGTAEIIKPHLAHKLPKISNECPFLTTLPLEYCTTLLFFLLKPTFIKKLNPIKEKLNFKKVSYKNLSYKNAKTPQPYIQNDFVMKITGPNYITKQFHTKKVQDCIQINTNKS